VFGGHNFGGIDYKNRYYTGLKNDLMMFHFSNKSWTTIQVDPTSPTPAPRVHHTAFLRETNTSTKLVISGGTSFLRYSGERSTILRSCGRDDVWEFDFTTYMWEQLVENQAECSNGVHLIGNIVLFVTLLVVLYVHM